MAKRSLTAHSRPHDPTALGRRFKQRLKRGELLLGGTVIEYLRPSLVKVYGRAGYDFIFLENEHAAFLTPQYSDFVLAARDNRLPVVSKAGQLDRAEVARIMDAGVVGLQLPATESREHVEQLIRYVKYPPGGMRPGAPCFGNVDYQPPGDDRAWLRKANAASVIVVHIETAKGYENAKEIVSTPGVDMVYVGPYDFSISMGQPGNYDHPDVRKPMQEILGLCKKHNVPFGTSASSPKRGGQWIQAGCQFFELEDEISLIASGATRVIESYRGR